MVQGKRYFKCQPSHGLFVPIRDALALLSKKIPGKNVINDFDDFQYFKGMLWLLQIDFHQFELYDLHFKNFQLYLPEYLQPK